MKSVRLYTLSHSQSRKANLEMSFGGAHIRWDLADVVLNHLLRPAMLLACTLQIRRGGGRQGWHRRKSMTKPARQAEDKVEDIDSADETEGEEAEGRRPDGGGDARAIGGVEGVMRAA
eukprot:CAMPEP_0174724124 /NCGR_PEP_ID=MMETSP1094-20130205/42642_1 /TAXON_ID=156173 /ORGANISM="Chrysochromulina brevifilum, Strain UTEX LB 985" /LENGTH=117 /DNA_ID=CAMNT_0015925293 /DNA_START=192 /DNA_END=546 /DNA_ORIENTATION=-